MRPEKPRKRLFTRGFVLTLSLIGILATVFYIAGYRGLGNFTAFFALLLILTRTVLRYLIQKAQTQVIPRLVAFHQKVLRWSIQRGHPKWVLVGVSLVMIGGLTVFIAFPPKVSFFPSRDPNYIYVHPQAT